MYKKIQLQEYLYYSFESNEIYDKYIIKSFDLQKFVNKIRSLNKNITTIINRLITKYAIENKLIHYEYNLMLLHIQTKPKSQINDVLSIKLICSIYAKPKWLHIEIPINPSKFQQILNEAVEILISNVS